MAGPSIEIAEKLLDNTKKNPKDIPSAHFIDNVEGFVEGCGGEPTEILKCLHELHGKYQYLQNNFLQTKQSTNAKLPDILSANAAVKHIKAQQAQSKVVDAQFQLSDNVYVNAEIPPGDKVALWLGANVMLEYSLDEAETLLENNEKTAHQALSEYDEALECLRDQLTVTEVNIARVHNYNVKMRAEQRAAETAEMAEARAVETA
jgi:prefoldin subunit 5